jgi:subtilisin family serine protease
MIIMSKKSCVLTLLALAAGLGGFLLSAPQPRISGRSFAGLRPAPGERFVANEILVKFKPGVEPLGFRSLAAGLRLQTVENLSPIGVLRVRTPDRAAFDRALADLRSRPEVEYADPNYLLQLASLPNDPYFQWQWAFRNTGQVVGPLDKNDFPTGTAGCDIRAATAWERTTGREGTIVGIVDTGIDLEHPDLVHNLLSQGYDFFNDRPGAIDRHGHGTHVAGIIAADGNNKVGVAGLCWGARIIPARVFDGDAVGPTSAVIKGIIYCADQGARAINMSLGGPDIVVSKALADAVKYAFDKGAVMAASAGNDGTAGVWYPAAYDEWVLAASATNYDDVYMDLAVNGGDWGSNYGPEVDVAAPGRFILSTWGRGLDFRGRPGWYGYNYGNKTSMSAAFVTGLATLIISSQPSLKNSQVMDIIRRSADDVNAAAHPGTDFYIGHGRINAAKALRLADQLAFQGDRDELARRRLINR